MITITSAQLSAWLALFAWPFARILALVASAPVTGNQQFPVTAKIGLAVLITLLVAPTLPAAPAVDPGGSSGLWLMVRETLLGLGMGLAMRVIFAAVEMAGELIGLQMGLGFAQFFDVQTSAQTQVIGQFLSVLATLIFLSLNAHLMLIAAVVESFHSVPVGAASGDASGWMTLAQWGGMIMQTGVLLALPLIAMLLITNTALAVLTRTAPALNLLAIGFPITILIGFIALLLSLPALLPALERAFGQGFEAMLRLVR